MPGQQTILTALKTLLTADNGAGGVNTLTGGRIYEGQGPQDAALPYVVFEIADDAPVMYFTGDDLSCVVRVETYGKRLNGSAQTRPITDRMLAILHEVSLTIVGYQEAQSQVINRGTVVAEDDSYHWEQTFRVFGS